LLKKYVGTLVLQAEFAITRGEVFRAGLRCVAHREETSTTGGSEPAGLVGKARPYHTKSITVSFPNVASANAEGLTFTVNNLIDEEGARLDGSQYARRAWSRGVVVRGTFEYDFVETAAYEAFKDGVEGSLTISFATVDGVAGFNINFPRIVAVRGGAGQRMALEGRTVAGLEWEALTGTGGEPAVDVS